MNLDSMRRTTTPSTTMTTSSQQVVGINVEAKCGDCVNGLVLSSTPFEDPMVPFVKDRDIFRR
jgi:hypothetical protein